MNDFESYVRGNTDRQLIKWMHYLEIYERHLSVFRSKAVHILEIGVGEGGSLQMWKKYFGPGARVYGVDINPNCKMVEEEQIRVFIGDQGDRAFLRSLTGELPRIDVVIDDGGHHMGQQIIAFEELFPRLADGGIYLCEDLHTSYWRKFGGGYRRRGTFIEYAKGLVDGLNAWYSKQPRRFSVDDFTRSAHSMHFYDSIVVIERRPMVPPHDEMTGGPATISLDLPAAPVLQRVRRALSGGG